MPFVIAALLLVGALCALDLVLTLGVIKRLRDQGALLAELGSGTPALAVGEEVGAFTATTVDGVPIGRDDLNDDTLVAFFSPTCGPCRKKLPAFVAHARTLPGGRDAVLATVVGTPEAAAAFTEALAPVARVVVEEADGPVGAAFNATAYPTVLRVAPAADGRVLVTADQVDLGRVPQAAA
ncbi:TlpA family protein disulfide reductase [Streptomyces sp. NPDC101132]|uniref:TlpA family protein disulfide reductase n=1 Tax=Streptomyces sp. NPDC101132 TaxID=3366110 RepID=UPI0038107734